MALFYPFTLDLWDDMGFAATFGIATGLWVASIVLAEWMRRAGYRGPAEVLLRRLSYRPAVSDEPRDHEKLHTSSERAA